MLDSLVKKTCVLSCGLMIGSCLHVCLDTQAYAQSAQATVNDAYKIRYDGSIWEQNKEFEVTPKVFTSSRISFGNDGNAYLLEVLHDNDPKKTLEAGYFEKSAEANLGQRLLLHAAQEMEKPKNLNEDEFTFAIQLALWSTKRDSGVNLDASRFHKAVLTNTASEEDFLSLIQKLYRISEGQNPYAYKLSTEKHEWEILNHETLIKKIGKLDGSKFFKGTLTSPSADLVITDNKGNALKEIGPDTDLYLTKKRSSLIQGIQTFELTPTKDLPHYDVYSDKSGTIKLVSDTPQIKPVSTQFSIDVSYELEMLKLNGLSDLTILEHKPIPDMPISLSPKSAQITKVELPAGLQFDETQNIISGTPVVKDWKKDEESRKLPLNLVAQNPDDKQQATASAHITLLRDTDKDGISDIDDTDDDNDGFSDEEEHGAGTDPKDKNSFPQTHKETQTKLELKAPADKKVLEHKSIEPIKIEVLPQNAKLSVIYIPKGISLSTENQSLYGEPFISDWKKDEEIRVFSPNIRAEHKDNFKETQFKLSVLRDTDKDGIPDIEDSDDDNDGFTDEFEIKAGTDPKDSKSYPQKPRKSKDDAKKSSDQDNTSHSKSSEDDDFWNMLAKGDSSDENKKGQNSNAKDASDISALPKTSDTNNYLIAPALTLGFISWLVILRRFLNFS